MVYDSIREENCQCHRRHHNHHDDGRCSTRNALCHLSAHIFAVIDGKYKPYGQKYLTSTHSVQTVEHIQSSSKSEISKNIHKNRNENQNIIIMTMMPFITFIYYVCVCVQNICFVVFTWWFLFIVYSQFFYCYFRSLLFRLFAIRVSEFSYTFVCLCAILDTFFSVFYCWCTLSSPIAINYPVTARGNFTSHCTSLLFLLLVRPYLSSLIFLPIPFSRSVFYIAVTVHCDVVCWVVCCTCSSYACWIECATKTKICYFYRYYYFH